jgi:hypothetical protein
MIKSNQLQFLYSTALIPAYKKSSISNELRNQYTQQYYSAKTFLQVKKWWNKLSAAGFNEVT